MSSLRPPDTALLLRYLSGEAGLAERYTVEHWADADPANARELDALARAWGLAPTGAATADAAQLWDRLQTQLDASAPARVNTSAKTPVRKPAHRRPWIGALAAGLAAIALAFGIARYRATTGNSSNTHTPRIQERTYAAAAGQRATVSLDDGTKVVLAPNTVLTVPVNFGHATRDVTVRGAALFEVAHTTGAPFSVRTAGIVTRVLGTTFAVRRYPGERSARIVVVNGKVSVRSASTNQDELRSPDRNQAIVSAGGMAVATDSGAIVLTPNVAVNDYLAPFKGRLVFTATSLRDVADELSRTYAADVQVRDSTLAERQVSFTAYVDRQSLTAILDALATTLHVHLERTGNVIVIAPGEALSSKLRLHPTNKQDLSYGR